MTLPLPKGMIEAAAKAEFEREWGYADLDQKILDQEWQSSKDYWIDSTNSALTVAFQWALDNGMARQGTVHHFTGIEEMPGVDYWQAVTNGAATFEHPALILKLDAEPKDKT
jgi:hypothetical protein